MEIQDGKRMSSFAHPLARSARFRVLSSLDDEAADVLEVVTTLALDPADDHFKVDKVTRLRAAVKDFLRAERPDIRGFVLVNPIKRG